MFNPNEGDDIWINDHWGPKQGVFQKMWPEKDKVLVEFHGSPEIVDVAKCYMTKQECYAAAAAKKQAAALEAMQQAMAYAAIASEQTGSDECP